MFRDTGSCRFGASCRFSHDGHTAKEEGAKENTDKRICFMFREQGVCKFGRAASSNMSPLSLWFKGWLGGELQAGSKQPQTRGGSATVRNVSSAMPELAGCQSQVGGASVMRGQC